MTSTAYCQNVACEGSSGVTCTRIPDTWTDPGWWEPEECPHCHGQLKDEAVDFENIVAGLIDELHQAELLATDAEVDERELLAAIQKELERQRLARLYVTVTCRECSGDGHYQAPNSVWEEGTLDLTCEACGGTGTVRVRRQQEAAV